MTFKEKYYSIDQSKLPEKAKVYMEEFKKDTKNFTDKEAMKIIMPTLDGFIKKLKESGYESAIKTSQTEKPTKEKVVKKKTAKEMVKEIVEEAVEQPKTTKGQPKMRTIKQGDYMRVAKEIRKEGEPWKDALKRAKEFITTQKEVKKEEAKRQYQKLKEFIQKQPEYYPKDIPTPSGGRRGTTLERDAVRVALPKGKRISKETGKAYYEYRSNRIDKRRDDYPFLAKGGEVEGHKHVLHIDGQNWFLEKIDSTHFYMSNDRNHRGMAHHIGQHKGEPYYEEVREWLKTTYAKGGSIYDGMSEKEFLNKYWGANVFFENPSEHFDIKEMSSSNDDKIDKFIEELKREGYSIKKKSYSGFTSVMGVRKKMAKGGELDINKYAGAGMFADGGTIGYEGYMCDFYDSKSKETKIGKIIKQENKEFATFFYIQTDDGEMHTKWVTGAQHERLKNGTLDIMRIHMESKPKYAKGGEITPKVNAEILERAEVIYAENNGSTKEDFDMAYTQAIREAGYNIEEFISTMKLIGEEYSPDIEDFMYAKGGKIPQDKSLKYFIMNEASSGSIANKTPYSSYKDIDGVRWAASQILMRDGDREYSLQAYTDLIKQAVEEYEENKYEMSFADGGYVDSNTLPMGVDSFVYFNTEEDGKIIWNIISATNDDAKSKKARNFLAKNQGEKITLKDGTQIKIDSYGQSSRFMLERDLKSNNGIVRVWNEFKPKYWSTYGGEEDLKKRAEKYSIKLAKAYRMYWLSDAADREERRFDKLVKESQISEEQLDRIKEYARETPIKDQRPNEIYKLLYADGGMTKRMVALPSGTREQIEESIRMGYDTLVEGMISPKTRGVMLIDKDSNVRGAYPMLYKGAIEEILLKVKGYAKGGYTATGEDYEYINTFGVAQNDFDEMVEAWHKTDSHDQMDRIESRLTFRRMINKYGEEKVESINKYIWDTHNAHEHSGEYAKGGSISKSTTYIPNRNIESIHAKIKDKKVTLKGKDILDGVYAKNEALNKPFDLTDAYNEIANLSYDAWDTLKIESGSEIYSSDAVQKKLADEYEKIGVDAAYMQYNAVQRRKIREMLTDENQHSLRNYFALRGYGGDKEYNDYKNLYEQYIKEKRKIFLNPANIEHQPKKKFAKGGAFGMGGKVIDFYSEIGSNDLKEELSEKIKKGDDVIHFAFTDYGGSFMDKVAIEYFEENYPDNIVVENTAYSGKNAFVFGQPATEWLESTQDYPLGFEDFEDYYYQRQNDVEYDGFKYFLEDLERDYSFDEQEVLDWLMENRSGYYSVDTQGIDFSYERLTEELEGEGLIKKSEEFAKGGKIGFKGLSKKVAKYYTNKKVPSEYQNLYGKTYDKKEAKEVGDKVASKVYRLQLSKMAKGGEVGTYIMTDDTYVNIFLSKGFVEKRGSMGLRFFEHKPTGIYITYDQKGYQIPVIITKDKSGEETIYEGNSIREVKDTLDKLGIKTIKEGIDNSMFAKGGEVGNTTHEKVTLIFDGKEHKYDMVFVDGVLEDILLPYSSMNTPLFDYLEKEFDDWMENVGGEYEAMYFSDEAIYSKRGAIRGAIEIIEETISEDKGKKKVYNLDKGEVDFMSAFS